jgi:hypothetical protein
MIDKLLLVILILLLPVGIVASRQVFLPNQGSGGNADQVKKVEELINRLSDKVQQGTEVNPKTEKINITAVTYASATATLRVAGMAPQGKRSITVSATILPPEVIPELNLAVDEAVLGQAVTVKAVKPRSDGSFVFEYPVEDTQGVVEISLNQGLAGAVVQYDLKLQKQVE